MGATRRITIEVSEAAATALEGNPERARLLADLALVVTPEDIRRLARDQLLEILSDPTRSTMTEEEVAEELAAWNAEGRS